jgi:hypothetical protein
MFSWRALWKLKIPSGWTLLSLWLVVGVGFLLNGLAKLNRGPDNFATLLEHIGAPYPLATGVESDVPRSATAAFASRQTEKGLSWEREAYLPLKSVSSRWKSTTKGRWSLARRASGV